MIYHFNTIFSGESIGSYYNRCCELVGDEDWICLWDADVMTFHTFGNMNLFLERAIKENPDTEIFSCVANRIGTHKQRIDKKQCTNPSMRYHRLVAEKRLQDFGTRVRKDTKTISGLMMLFNKSVWRAVGGFSEDGIIAVDTKFSMAIFDKGYKVGILEGLYVMHYYRLLEGNHNHLKK